MFGDHSELEPPDPIPNSEVKRFSADGSVGSPHVRVGHRQALIRKKLQARCVWGFFFVLTLQWRCPNLPWGDKNRKQRLAAPYPM